MTQKRSLNKARIFFMYVKIYGLISYTLFSGCSPKNGDNTTSSQIFHIATTTGILEDAVKNIVRDSAHVQALMGPGVDPHIYKATQGDIKILSQANLIFHNGLHLEGKLSEVLEKLSRTREVIAASAGVPSHQYLTLMEEVESYDPHLWFDVSLWRQVVNFLGNEIMKRDTVRTKYYEQNTALYLKKLDSLHQAVKSKIQEIPQKQRVLITAHDAFGYFGRAYDIEVKGLQGISTVADIGLRDVSNLVKFIVEHNIKAVFIESSVSPKAIEAVVEGCRQRGHQVAIGGTLYSDALGAKGSGAETYIDMVDANVRTIVDALK
jgi:manganese/zinc/iron transport system substrate-binding protein